MARGYAPSFTHEAADVFYNNSGTAISKGCLVTWSGTVTSYEDPIPEHNSGKKPMLANQATRTDSVTRPIMGIALKPDSIYNHPVGVAAEDIGVTAWGLVVRAGVCDVKIGISSNIASGDYLVGTAGGLFKEDATSVTATTVIHAIALEATITSGTCAAALVQAVLNIPVGGAAGKRS